MKATKTSKKVNKSHLDTVPHLTCSSALWRSITTSFIRLAAVCGSRLISVSQSLITLQPSASSKALFSLSRSILLSIFDSQYSAFVPWQSFDFCSSQLRPCQKSPSQKTATRARTKTISGLPGKSPTFFRYLKPVRHSSHRSVFSCCVSVRRLRRFARELASDAGFKPVKDGDFTMKGQSSRSANRCSTQAHNSCLKAISCTPVESKLTIRTLSNRMPLSTDASCHS